MTLSPSGLLTCVRLCARGETVRRSAALNTVGLGVVRFPAIRLPPPEPDAAAAADDDDASGGDAPDSTHLFLMWGVSLSARIGRRQCGD